MLLKYCKCFLNFLSLEGMLAWAFVNHLNSLLTLTSPHFELGPGPTGVDRNFAIAFKSSTLSPLNDWVMA